MSQSITLKREGQWVSLSGTLLPILGYVKNYIRPTAYRKFDSTTGCWLVYYTKLPDLLKVINKHYSEVNYVDVPVEWGGQSDTSIVGSPYKILYLLDDAPMEVVKAAYRALSLKNHPDVGGDGNAMVVINAAYALICKEKE